jgi:predicted membrane channel-forming protein YqfA (hemolysin III family)
MTDTSISNMAETPINKIADTPIKEEKISTYNKKAIRLIAVLIIGGTALGLILSSVFITEVNNQIKEVADEVAELFGGSIPSFIDIRVTPLTTSEIILPTLGVIVVCISMFLLIGLLAVYFKVFAKTKSKYIIGLFFVLMPLFIESIFLVCTLRSLYASPAIPALSPGHNIHESIGFEMGGLGQILVIATLFENIGLCILLYLSNE